MSTTKPTDVEQALAAAGAELTHAVAAAGTQITAALDAFGYRMVASTALGQIIAGLPDAAKGMIAAMPAERRARLAEDALALYELAVDSTEYGQIVAAYRDQLPAPDAQTYHNAQVFVHALDRRDLLMMRRLTTSTPDQLDAIRAAATKLVDAITDLQVARDTEAVAP